MVSRQNQNVYTPYLGKLVDVRDIATEIKLFTVELNETCNGAFRDTQPGQFAFLSAFGYGEAPFGITAVGDGGRILEFAIQRLGCVTSGLHELGPGDIVGVRGPMGNHFPMNNFKGKDLIVIGGGIGGAPLRPVIHWVMNNRRDYGRLMILWAARNPSLLIFSDEYDLWRATPDTEVHLTVDQADKYWDHHIGLVTDLIEQVNPSPLNSIAITCGPPVMIHFVGKLLERLGFSPEQCYTTLEARMHCGVGKCGRCNLGEKLICTDGPVFSMQEANRLLESIL